eukprot:jgi/Ulvmu1/10122/UM006_0074.1
MSSVVISAQPITMISVKLQDTVNEQSGVFLDVRLSWPSSPLQLAQVKSLLAAHPGRSLALTVAVPMRPVVQWRQSPQALNFTSSPISWRSASHLDCFAHSFRGSPRHARTGTLVALPASV